MRTLGLFRTILGNRDIRLVELAWTAGIAAETAWLVSLLVYAHDTGGVFAVGLMSDVSRTASVTLTRDSEVFQLERSDFLAAVTGSDASVAAADRLVAQRLSG